MRALITLALLSPLAGAQTTWHVDVSGTPPGIGTVSAPYTSIQYAIDQATTVDGDTLAVAPGTYVENVALGPKALRLIATAGPELTTIQAAGPGRVVDFNGGLELRGFTITGGQDPTGDGVRVSNLFDGLIERCLIVGNARRGLSFGANSTTSRVRNCTITGNGGPGWYQSTGTGGDVRNTIVWGNGQPSSYSLIGALAYGFFRFNDLEDFPLKNKCGLSNVCGNIQWDPLLVDPANGDYRLRLGSPCVDAGDPLLPLDPDGSPPDMGALIFDPASSPGPSVYCSSKVNSLGCTPAIGFTGSPSASGAPFDITCSNVINNKLGLLFYGYQAKALPYQEGTLCVTAPVKRTPVQSAGGNPPPDDCSGQYTYDFDARIQSGLDPNLMAGALVYAQYWYRDPQHLGAFTTGRSDAVAFLISP